MDPRAILEIQLGPLSGAKAVIPKGGTLKVGRSERAGFTIGHDTSMSALHFEIGWDGERATIRDLGSVNGTLLGGLRAREGEVKNGGWVRAGDTDFMMFIEGRAPAKHLRRGEAGPSEMEIAHRRSVIAALREGAGRHLYAVLDAARDDRILALCHTAVEEAHSLYEGREGEALADVAPYLVSFEPNSRLLEALIHEGWGERWGIYLVWSGRRKDLRTHLRRFLMVEDEATEERLYFRFYDPAVLRVVAPTFSPRQRSLFFGDVQRIMIEGADRGLSTLSKEVD